MNSKDFYKNIRILLKKLSNIFWIILEVVLIILIAGLAGMQSEKYIYLLNEYLGYEYAHIASYFESACIGIILFQYIFKEKSIKYAKTKRKSFRRK